MKAIPCLVAIVLAVAVTFLGCDGFPSDYAEVDAHHEGGADNQHWDNKEDAVRIAPIVPAPRHDDYHGSYGHVGGWEGRNELDKVLEDVKYGVNVSGNYGKGGVVSGISLGKVHAKSVFVQGVN